MSVELFIPKFVGYFSKIGYQFLKPDIKPDDLHRSGVFSTILFSGVTSVALGLLGASPIGGAFLSTDASNATNKDMLATLLEIQKYGELVGIVVRIGQPRVILIVYGEELNDEEIIGRFVLIRESVQKIKDFGMRVSWAKMPADCVVFTVFSSHSKAAHFKEALEQKCKHYKLFWDLSVPVLPWTVDLERKRVRKCNALWATPDFKEERFEKFFFD